MNLEGIMLSEVSLAETNIIWFHLYVKSKKQNKAKKERKTKQSHKNREQRDGYQEREGGGRGEKVKGNRNKNVIRLHGDR